jgi:hypothetical protein
MQCERVAEPGRVKCSLEVHAPAHRSIAWADAVLLEVPAFAAALKGRLGPTDITGQDATSQKWAFGLVARKAGQGEARARVRLVVCEAESGGGAPTRCSPTTIDVRTTVQVG